MTDGNTGAPDIPIAELFVALTARWRREDGSLAFGVSEKTLLKKAGLTLDQWRQTQLSFRERVEALGVELTDYTYLGQRWWCCRALYPVPPELTDEEMAVLAVVLYEAQRGSETARRTLEARCDAVKSLIVEGGYLTNYAFDRTVNRLQDQGYLKRSRAWFHAEPRLLLEIPEENRRYLAEQVEKLVV